MTYNQENYRVIIEHQQEQYERKFFKILQNSSDEKLLPCPFCGCHAHVEQSCNGGRRLLYWVECEECYSRSQSYFDHPDRAVESWNRRVKDD